MNTLSILMFLCVAFLMPAGTAAAASKQEQILHRETAQLDATASTPQGEKAVKTRLSHDFTVAPERLEALRARGLGYGEITVALSCARTLPGSAIDENIERVLTLRQGPPQLGWGGVAQKLGVKLGACVSQVKKVNNESHREMKKDKGMAAQKAQHEAGPAPSPEKHKKFEGEGKSLPQGQRAQ